MSVFQKLRKLSENPDSDREEDFLTEIFAHALKSDLVFKEAFFSKLPKEYRNQQIQSIETQKVYPALGTDYPERRPDIEINLQDAVIIIENKVRSGEGLEQLPDYAKILNLKTDTNKLLVYITVYLDIKKYPLPSGVDFVPLRWQEIGELISPKCGDFAREMKVYLKSEKLMMKNFDYQDLAALNTFFSTAEKINGIFRDDVGPYFVREIKMHSFINNQRAEIVKFFTDNIDKMEALKIKFPEIFGNPTPDATTIEQQVT